MRKLASIQRIWKIEPIDGADKIELAFVLGWRCVVNKGQFKPMDSAGYFEIVALIGCNLFISGGYYWMLKKYKK